MVDSLDESKSSISLWKGLSKLRDAGRPEFPVQQEMLASRNRKPKKRTGFYEEDRSPS